MNRIAKRHNRNDKGFTLVELLIVFTLLAVLAAIMIPNVAGLIGHGQTESAAAELSIIQTAMDSMMAKENQSTVTEVTVGTSDMSSFPDGSYALWPDYLRYQTTTGNYTCTTTGNVTQTSTGY